jgi:3-hydroxyisobutyrate dehydrogenase-like beta-hydroxyacid dehydrogenase
MLKDVGYALELAAACGLALSGAENAREALEKTIAAGFGAEYFPALAQLPQFRGVNPGESGS